MNPKSRASYMWELIGKSPALTVPWYLGLSWLYYHWDITLVPDDDFDRLCSILRERFESLEHTHKTLVNPAMLGANSGFYLRHDDIPTICRSSFHRLAFEDGHVKLRRGRLVRAYQP